LLNPFQKYKMVIAYDGTRYSGWQIQPNSQSIQGTIEQALSTLLKSPTRIIGAGRTDAGVHAQGQVAHFSTQSTFKPDQLLYALNGMLPADIRIKNLHATLDTFHAQISALSKEYHYHLWLEKIIDPFVSRYRLHFCYSHFSLTLLQEAAQAFIGTHDFATFANVGSKVTTTVRTIQRITIVPQEGGVRLEFQGNGFLYKMVRNIVGTLLEVALGKKIGQQIPTMLAAHDRKVAGPAASPKGLFLMKIDYPECFANSSSNERKCENGLGIPSEIF